LRRCGLGIGGPVEYIPVVADSIDQLIVLGGLLGIEVLQMLGHKSAQQEIVFQHSAFPALIQKAAQDNE